MTMVSPRQSQSIAFAWIGNSIRKSELKNRIFFKEPIYYHFEFSFALENKYQLRVVKRRDDCIPNRDLSTYYYKKREEQLNYINLNLFNPVKLESVSDDFPNVKLWCNAYWNKFIVVIGDEVLYFS
ncbi:hypothetical protein [Selenomonas ruminantium]|uniref:hypothetical protein n=1 Tax=Selenomonas ruminantium TaxID=971 RepID=UPI0011610640|nr:hypothetical protein [Selenomonas ruminantium]